MTFKSSMLKSAPTHDPATRMLTLDFHNGGEHHFHDVPAEVHAAMIAADSVGSFFHAHIKGKYKSTKAGAHK